MISTAGYIGMMILFSIPIVGWLACVIMAFAAKNLNRRNFARAMIIVVMIMIVISIALYFVIGWVWEVIRESVSGYTTGITGGGAESLGGISETIGGMTELFDLLKSLN